MGMTIKEKIITDTEEERCEKCEHFHRLKHNFEVGTGFEESNCCDVLLHLPDSTDDTKPWVQEVSQLDMCEMFTEVKQDKPTTKNDKVDCEHTDCNNCVNHKYCDYEPTTKNNLGVDCISRQATISAVKRIHPVDTDYDCTLYDKVDVMYVLDEMPSVTPQLRKGHWISTETKGVRYAFWCRYECSLCGGLSAHTNFCPNCGAKMESEDKE